MAKSIIKKVGLFKRYDGTFHYTVYYESGMTRRFNYTDNVPNTIVEFIFNDERTANTAVTDTGTVTWWK